MARSNSDIYWKGILEDLFADFLRFFYPNADELFDINRGFEFLDQECEKLFPVGDPEHPKSVDKLVKLFTKESKEEWMLIHIEVQGYKDDEFAERMFTYFYRIRDSFGKRVRSIAIFTDSNKRFHPGEYTYQEEDTSVIFRFKTYKVIEQDPVALEQSGNPFAVVILTVQLALKKKKLKADDYFTLTIDLVRRLYTKGFNKESIRQLLGFIKAYVDFDKPEINSKFDSEIDKLDNKTRTMGIIEQIAEIRAEEVAKKKNAAFVKKLLHENIFTVEKIADLAEVSVEFVEKINKQVKLK
jgi:hypothetical protein